MANKQYYDKDAERQKRVKKRKKSSFGKNLLLVISFLVIALVVFVITVKVANPSYDFSQLVPEKVFTLFDDAQEFIDEKVWGKTTTTTTSAPSTTQKPEPTTKAMLDYIEESDFAFKTSVQGSQMGTLLNGGLVGTDMSYIYHYVPGKGIYRFVPSTEQYTLYFGITNKISCINLRGDYIYYVNNKDNCLYKLQKGTSEPKKLAEDVQFAYVYDTTVYFVTTTGKVCVMDAKELVPVTAYYANGDEVNFVGVSLTRVFFTVTDFQGNVEYLTVDNYGHSMPKKFRKSTKEDKIKKLQLENGFFYYYKQKKNGSYDLVRQKYGSKRVVTLIKNASARNYPEINSNRLYYSEYKDGVYRLKELNMNSGDKKTMLSVTGVKADNRLSFYLGGEYNFIIGEKSENGDDVYKASSIYTSSTNAMTLKNDKWSY